MTRNQRRAIDLAVALADHRLRPRDLADADWHLLLLAAGTNCVTAVSSLVVDRVIVSARRHTGYFEPRHCVAERFPAAVPCPAAIMA